MGVVSVTSGLLSAVVSGGEQELTQQMGVGVYTLNIDLANLVAGDSITVRIKTRCRSTDDTQVSQLQVFTDAQALINWFSLPILNYDGGLLVLTVEQTAGVDRTFPWNLLRA